MIAELANTMNSQDENIDKSAYQRMLFPAPAKRGKTISLHNYGKGWRQRTFAVNPQKRTCVGPLPFREGIALDEPRRSPHVAQFTGDFVI
jgi:hypothetical protein